MPCGLKMTSIRIGNINRILQVWICYPFSFFFYLFCKLGWRLPKMFLYSSPLHLGFHNVYHLVALVTDLLFLHQGHPVYSLQTCLIFKILWTWITYIFTNSAWCQIFHESQIYVCLSVWVYVYTKTPCLAVTLK